MAEYIQQKSRSSRSFKEEEARKSKSRKNKYHRADSKHYFSESRTPPLPGAIEDLLKQRDSLKEELYQITKKSENELKVIMTEQKFHTRNNTNRSNAKRSSYDRARPIPKKCRKISDASPDHTQDTHLDSEDEESIIEQRRLQRKKLIEKLITSCNDKHKGDKEIVDKQNKNSNNDNKEKMIVSIPIPAAKVVPDMFSEKDDFGAHNVLDKVKQDIESNTQLTDNWDDSEGYYNTKIGDIIDNRYTIKSILGQGVFANVVRAQDIINNNSEVAIKIIRNNDMMHKVGLKEISLIKELNKADKENKYHCVQLLTHFKHKGHLCLVLEPLCMDMRGVIKKYGRHGLNMKALMSYSRQLMLALRLLKKLGIIHSDLKPDNILVNEKKNVLKLCDFGSATKLHENEPTPYLVSRFYRAPEIILGIPHSHGIDMWSAGCTLFEMATGKILFTGSSNNKMLKCFMDFKGKIPSRIIKKGKFKDQHFNYNHNFLLHKKDEATCREKVVEISNITATKDLYTELQKNCNILTTAEEKKLLQLKDLIDKIFMFDPNHRPSIVDCLKHPFIQDVLEK